MNSRPLYRRAHSCQRLRRERDGALQNQRPIHVFVRDKREGDARSVNLLPPETRPKCHVYDGFYCFRVRYAGEFPARHLPITCEMRTDPRCGFSGGRVCRFGHNLSVQCRVRCLRRALIRELE